MDVGWLFDGSVFDRYAEEMASAAKQIGVHLVDIQRPLPPYEWDDVDCAYRRAFPKGACVVVHADMDLVTRVQEDGKWTPGAFANIERLHCSHYYTHLGQYLLGERYTMLPFGELSRCRAQLFDQFGHEGRIFVRPDSPLKLFAGQLASGSTFDRDIEYMSFYEFPSESLVVVTKPRDIVREWRFVVVDQTVVAGSLYKFRGITDIQPQYSTSAHALAEQVAATEFAPDRAWIVDICETAEGDVRLIEIGAFSFCDLYACDKVAVIEAVSKASLDLWERSVDRHLP